MLVKEKLSNGNTINYNQLDNGTCYHEQTPDKLVEVLEYARQNRNRVRVYYGNNGKSWHEENDTIGYIGRSTGNIKIPLLVYNNRSFGGGALLDHCIVKIVTISSKRVLYQHDDFSQSVFTIKENKVFQDKSLYANCKNESSAKRLCDFMNGYRNSK